MNPWLDPESELYAMGVLLDPMRIPYFHGILTTTLLHKPAELSVLDVGCGGGSIAMHLAKLGYRVTGVDPDQQAIEAAMKRAETSETDTTFFVAPGEKLPFPASSFDVVICSEVLEHVENLETTLDEVYRVLRFGGVLLFSTPNRTILTHLLLIKVAQDWRPTRVMGRIEHRLDRLIRPGELATQLDLLGIDVYEIKGVRMPIGTLPSVLTNYLRFKRGKAPLAHLASSMRLTVGGRMQLAYIGWGVKFG